MWELEDRNMWAKTIVGGLVAALGVCAFAGCGTYSALAPDARTVTASTMRPPGKCISLGTVTGKGGGASGGYVSNEELIEYALNDARNRAAMLGATDFIYSGPSLGGSGGTTTSAMVTGEALKCDGEPSTEMASGSAPAPAPTAANPSPPSNGCQFDTQCKGERVCVRGECVEPSPASAKATPPEPPATAPTPPAQ
jgi:hypothetical protein